MKKKLSLFLALASLSLLISAKVFSAENNDTEIRLQQVENKIATDSSKTTTSSKPKISSITYTEGKLLALSGSSLILETTAETKKVSTSDSTKYFSLDSSSKKLIGFVDLKIGDSLIVLGLAPNEVSGTGKMILRNTVTIENKSFSFLAKVREIKGDSIVLKDSLRDDLESFSVQYTNETTIKTNSKTLKISDVKTSSKVVIVGFISEKGVLSAKEILILD